MKETSRESGDFTKETKDDEEGTNSHTGAICGISIRISGAVRCCACKTVAVTVRRK